MIPGSNLRRAWIWGPVAVYLVVIYSLSAQSNVGWAEPYPDVVLHAIEYAMLGVLVARGLNGGLTVRVPDRRMVLAWTLCVLYAVSDEYHQAFVPGRSSDWRDVLSDAAGSAAALALLSLAQRHLPGLAPVAAPRARGVRSPAVPIGPGGRTDE